MLFERNYVGFYAVPNPAGNTFTSNGSNVGPFVYTLFNGAIPLAQSFAGQNPLPLNSQSYAGMLMNDPAASCEVSCLHTKIIATD